MQESSTILLKRSDVIGATPALTSLSAGELAINTADGVLFARSSSGTILSFLNDKKIPYTFDADLSSVVFQVGNNTVTEIFGAVLGGYNNDVDGGGSTVVNGENNDISGDFALIGGGLNNFIGVDGDYSGILGGKNNTLDHPETFIIGSNIVSHLSGVTYVNILSATNKIYGDGGGITNVIPKDVESYATKGYVDLNFIPLSAASLSSASISTLSAYAEALSIASKTLSSVIFTVTDKVGVNTAVPNEALTVIGNVSATGFYYGNGTTLTGVTLDSNFNDYKTNVGSATATLVKTTDFNDYKTEVGSATATLVKSVDFNDYKTEVGSATATLVKSVDFNEYKTNVGSATATLVKTTDFNDYKTEVGSATASNTNYVHSNFLPLTGGIISGETRINSNLTIWGNLSASGTTTFANTLFSTTSALSVVHIGSGPAMWVGNNGDGDIASFYDIDEGIEILHIGGNNGSYPNVGVKTSQPNKDFTVNGEISANNTIYDATGNSTQWNQAYSVATTYQNSSGSFATNTLLQSTSALLTPLTLTNTLTSLLVLNTDFNDYKTNVGSATATLVKTTDFNDYKTSVESATATLLPTTTYQGASGNWEEVYTVFKTVSTTFITSETDSQTLTFDEVTNELTITSGNTITLSALVGAGTFTPLTLTNTLTTDLLGYIKQLAPPPTYSSPTASITNFNPTAVEIGANVSRTLTLNWSQNNAGTRGTWRLNKNGTEITSDTTAFPVTYEVNETAALNTTTYQLSVNFGTGAIVNNSLGFPDDRGRILAGSVTNSSSYVGYYRRWIGSNATFPSSPTSIRDLGLTTTLDTNNTLASQSSPIYINNKFILIAIPNTKTLATVVTKGNESLTSQFNLSSIQIPDAGNTLRDYKLYYLETAVPLLDDLTTVTIN